MMDNFYEEHEGYKKLKEALVYDLRQDLADIVSDAVMYGMQKMEKVVKEVMHGNSTGGTQD